MDYIIAIPSYQRAETLQEKTLQTLQNCNIPSKKINIFVADKKEYQTYQETLHPQTYNKIIIGKPTLHQQRNYIRQYYPENQKILYLDDDIKEILILNKKQQKLDPFTKLDQLTKLAFKLCKKYHTTLHGIYPVKNHFFMSNSINKGLYYIIGCMYWNINKHNPNLQVTIEDKEDYERTIKEYQTNKAVLRFNNITVNTNYYTEPGGMQVTRTPTRITKSAHYLYQKYPQLTEINKQRKKHTEIKFKKQPCNTKIYF